VGVDAECIRRDGLDRHHQAVERIIRGRCHGGVVYPIESQSW
jgi:hypothetical protein